MSSMDEYIELIELLTIEIDKTNIIIDAITKQKHRIHDISSMYDDIDSSLRYGNRLITKIRYREAIEMIIYKASILIFITVCVYIIYKRIPWFI